ncbi:hypothetical protein EV122DRAFT_264133 [Schizophyllum commune]
MPPSSAHRHSRVNQIAQESPAKTPRNEPSIAADASGYDLSGFGDISLTKPFCLPGREVDWDERPQRLADRVSRAAPANRTRARANSGATAHNTFRPTVRFSKDSAGVQTKSTPLTPRSDFRRVFDEYKKQKQNSNALPFDLSSIRDRLDDVRNHAVGRDPATVISRDASRPRTLHRANPATARVRPEQIYEPKGGHKAKSADEESSHDEGESQTADDPRDEDEIAPDRDQPTFLKQATPQKRPTSQISESSTYQSSAKVQGIQEWAAMVQKEREREEAAEKLKHRVRSSSPAKIVAPKKIRAPATLAHEEMDYLELIGHVPPRLRGEKA